MSTPRVVADRCTDVNERPSNPLRDTHPVSIAAHADPAGLRSALHAEAARLGRVGRRPTTTSSSSPGDLLDIASIVEPDAQIAVVLEYLARIAAKTTVVACSGNHDLNARNEHGERVGALARSGARGRRLRRRDPPRDRRRARDRVPVVGRAATARRVDRQLADDAATRRRPALDLGVPRAARRVADELDRQAALRRRGARRRGSSSTSPTSCCAGTCTSRRSRPTALDRPHRLDAGLQRRPAARADADAASSSTPTRRAARWSSLDGVEERVASRRGPSTRDRDRVPTRARCVGPSCASGSRARRRPCRARLRGRRTAA